MEFKSKFKLIFDIETNAENMHEVLDVILKNISKEFKENIKGRTEVTCDAKIEKFEVN